MPSCEVRQGPGGYPLHSPDVLHRFGGRPQQPGRRGRRIHLQVPGLGRPAGRHQLLAGGGAFQTRRRIQGDRAFQLPGVRLRHPLGSRAHPALSGRHLQDGHPPQRRTAKDPQRTGSGQQVSGRGPPGGGRGQPGQERVPGQHEPRDPDPHERHHGPDPPGAQNQADPPSRTDTCAR